MALESYMVLRKAMRTGRLEILDVSKEADHQQDMVTMLTLIKEVRLNETEIIIRTRSRPTGIIASSLTTLELEMRLARVETSITASPTVEISRTNPTNRIINNMVEMLEERQVSIIIRMKIGISTNHMAVTTQIGRDLISKIKQVQEQLVDHIVILVSSSKIVKAVRVTLRVITHHLDKVSNMVQIISHLC